MLTVRRGTQAHTDTRRLHGTATHPAQRTKILYKIGACPLLPLRLPSRAESAAWGLLCGAGTNMHHMSLYFADLIQQEVVSSANVHQIAREALREDISL